MSVSNDDLLAIQHIISAGREKVEHVTPEYIDTKVSEASMDDLRGAMRARMVLRNKHMLTQYAAHVHLSSDYPIQVVHLADTHAGSGDTNHDRLERDLQTVLDTPGVYVTYGSNMIDNAIPGKFPDGMLQNLIPPEEQVVYWRKWTMELDKAGKILGAIVSPCHEGWTWAKAGQDINRLLYDYDGRKFPILENGGKLLIDLNGVEYYWALYHQMGPFNSNLNKNNATKRMRELQHRNADIVSGAHHHVAEAMMTYCDKQTDMKPLCFLRGGTYKTDDQWAGGKGYVKGEPGGRQRAPLS